MADALTLHDVCKTYSIAYIIGNAHGIVCGFSNNVLKTANIDGCNNNTEEKWHKHTCLHSFTAKVDFT